LGRSTVLSSNGMVTFKKARRTSSLCIKMTSHAKNIAPERTIYRIIENFRGERFDCCKEGFRMSQTVKQRSPPEELGTTAMCRHQCRSCSEGYWQQVGVSASEALRVLDNSLVSKRAAKKPLLSKKNIKVRLKFCRKYKD